MQDSSSKSQHLVIVDGYGFVFRAYHAVPALVRDDGIKVNAVYGFTSMLMKVMSDIKATHIVVVFDAGKKNFRNDLYANYKAHRPSAPDDLIPQFSIVREAATSLNIHIIEQEGYEADDIIATIVKKIPDVQITIVSSDKDLMQLIDDNVSMFDPVKSKIIRKDEVFEKFGVMPNKVCDVLAIIGDSSDNIPGIPGIGPKGAMELITEFNSLEELYLRSSEIKQERKRNLVESNKDIALLSKKLVTLYNEVPCMCDLNLFEIKEVNIANLLSFLKAQNFKSLVTRAQNQFSTPIKTILPQMKYLSDKKYSYLTNFDQLKEFIKSIYQKNQISLFMFSEQNIVAIVLSSGIQTIYIPIIHNQQPTLELDVIKYFAIDEIKILLKEILIDTSIVKIFYNYKDFIHKCFIDAVALNDILLMSYCLNGTTISNELDYIINHYLDINLESLANLKGSGRNKLDLEQIEFSKLVNYGGARAELILELYNIFKEKIFYQKSKLVYEKLERPLSYILYDMENIGIKINSDKLKSISIDFARKIKELEIEIFKLSETEFNIGSPKQLAEILYDKLKLSSGKKSKTGNFSTSADILEDLAHAGHLIADKILEWRSISKLKNTYTDSLIKQADVIDRVHTRFDMAATSTGRLSSNDPNLQNIPIRSPEGMKIRSCFIAKDGYRLLSCDYSQIELRILAHMANIEALKQAFKSSVDIHSATASQVFGVNIEDVDANMRRKAKAINFGIIYGISSFGLAKQLSISRFDAANYIKMYFNTYPGIEKFMNELKDFARIHGYVKTLYGRKCYVKSINDSNPTIRSMAERATINAPIQGTAADIIKAAMVKIYNILQTSNLDCKMLLQVHDELVFEAAPQDIEKVSKIIKREMEQIIQLSVNLTVDVKIGNSWGNMEHA